MKKADHDQVHVNVDVDESCTCSWRLRMFEAVNGAREELSRRIAAV
jgi:hypothetical protein